MGVCMCVSGMMMLWEGAVLKRLAALYATKYAQRSWEKEGRYDFQVVTTS